MRLVGSALVMGWVLGCGGTSKHSESLAPSQKAETAAQRTNPVGSGAPPEPQASQTAPEPPRPPPVVDAVPNEFGLRCYGKPAANHCSEPPPQFDVDEQGNAKQAELPWEAICGKTILYGCDDERGKEIVPFIHRREFGGYPVKFFPSGFALVEETYGPNEEGGWFFINATYTKRLMALTVEAVPDVWQLVAPDWKDFVHIGRYSENGRIGFLDLNKGIITPAKFTAAFSFSGSDGMRKEVLVCEDCHPRRWDYCAPREAYCSGNAYVIGRDGKRLKKQPDKEWWEYWWCKAHPGRKDLPKGFDDCQ